MCKTSKTISEVRSGIEWIKATIKKLETATGFTESGRLMQGTGGDSSTSADVSIEYIERAKYKMIRSNQKEIIGIALKLAKDDLVSIGQDSNLD